MYSGVSCNDGLLLPDNTDHSDHIDSLHRNLLYKRQNIGEQIEKSLKDSDVEEKF